MENRSSVASLLAVSPKQTSKCTFVAWEDPLISYRNEFPVTPPV